MQNFSCIILRWINFLEIKTNMVFQSNNDLQKPDFKSREKSDQRGKTR